MIKSLKQIGKSKRLLGVYLLPVIVALLATVSSNVLLNKSEYINRLEGMADDAAWLQLPKVDANPKIVLILIDSKTCTALGESENLLFLPRRFFSALIKGLDAARAKVVALDLALNGREPSDSGFSQALAGVKNAEVVLVKRSKKSSAGSEFVLENTDEELEEPNLVPSYTYDHLTLAHGHAMEAEGMTVAPFPWLLDPRTTKGIPYVGFAASLLTLGLDPNLCNVTNEYDLRCGSVSWELGGNKDYMVRWTKASNPFETVSFQKALELLKNGDNKLFEGKTVVIGESRIGKDETKTAPYGNIPGVLFVAHTINTFLLPSWERVRWADQHLTLIFAFGLSVLASSAVMWPRKILGILALIVVLVIAAGYPAFMASVFKLRVESVPLVLSVLLSMLITTILLSLVVGKIDTRSPGTLDEATLIFSDIVGSTQLTSEIGARKYQEIYTDFISMASLIIERHGGSIERTRGDGFLAVFRSHSRQQATLASIECAELILQKAKLPIRLSVESGIVSGGYVSEGGRRVWSSTGNTVNLTARMLDACDQFDRNIVIGPTAAKLVEETRKLPKLGKASFKGFQDQFVIFGLENSPESPHSP